MAGPLTPATNSLTPETALLAHNLKLAFMAGPLTPETNRLTPETALLVHNFKIGLSCWPPYLSKMLLIYLKSI